MSTLLDEYKERYGDVYLMDVKGREFIFRPLTRKEYQQITRYNEEGRYHNEYHAEEVICAVATVYPENYDFSQGLAGVVKPLSQRIIEVSGYADPEQTFETLNHYRHDMQRFDNQAVAVISLVFQGTREEEINEWTQQQFLRKLSQAEWIMKYVWNLPFEFTRKGQEEGPETEPPTIKEMGDEIREQGGDPMMELSGLYRKRPDAGYVQFPIIGGTKLFQNEEVLNNVREQIQRLPDG